MKNILIAGAVAASLAVPASAATIDFTANNLTTGNVLDTTWTASGSPNGLTNATHDNRAGCTGHDWEFACAGSNPYDVGFGVRGNNNNEIDGKLNVDEFVKIVFGKMVKITGFAGMLTYANSSLSGAREQVALDYWDGSQWKVAGVANPLAVINQIPGGDTSFDTVGLAFLKNLAIYTDKVRFRATGEGTSDDGSFNVTAAALEVAPVPVPAGLPLLLTGLGALAWGARRRKRNAA